ncbi:hypothetical protein L1049_001369 [Liquidambar formosana]|uniref:ADP-ribosyl cyclase/cyclic ADP-ribose hydrolase n=1 Tax=Liquidambar formosana TaxID=63359 RepID=A0AAP0R631_LIQFO
MAFNRTLKTCFSSSSSSSSSSHRWSYDVFLSFRGEDTRKKFIEDLYSTLKNAGINTFSDDDELRRGEDIATGLHSAIQESKISIVVFSKNYAASRWCLEELLKIIECRKTVWQLVVPIFYDVDPSDVRNQTGSFGKAFAKLTRPHLSNRDKVVEWRKALTTAGNLAGFRFSAKRAMSMDCIVETVVDHLGKTFNHLQSLSENMNELEIKYEQLNCQKEDVESKTKANPWPEKRRKREIELWLADVRRINVEKQSIESEVEVGKFSKCASLGELVAEKIQEVEELHQKGRSFCGLTVDASPGDEEICPTDLASTTEREMDEIHSRLRNNGVQNIIINGIGGIGNTTITDSFKNIQSINF